MAKKKAKKEVDKELEKEETKKKATKKEEKKEKKEKKRSSKKKGKKEKEEIPELENALPQNILQIGGRVDADKNIYILQSVYNKIHKFTQDKTDNESGGFLIGKVIEEFGKANIIIEAFIEAKYTEATPTTLTFTHETWDACHKELDEKYDGKKILGWIHTHPDFGIFLSEYDKFIHENFFGGENQIAYVIDAIRGEEGFYFWINGKLEKCNGFFVYDKEGKTIEVEELEADIEDEEVVEDEKRDKRQAAIIMILVILLLLSLISNFRLRSENNKLSQEMNAISQYLYQQQLIPEGEGVIVIDGEGNVIDGGDTTQPSEEGETQPSEGETQPTEGETQPAEEQQ